MHPRSRQPAPLLHVPALEPADAERLGSELLAMYDGAEVVFQWVEFLREQLMLGEGLAEETGDVTGEASEEVACEGVDALTLGEPGQTAGGGGVTFIPNTTRYGQRVRHFDAAAVDDAHRVQIAHGENFHPPKSGPSECFQAHVARVESMSQVQWVLRELLDDKRVARATHNMIAYRFWDIARGVQVADNDDDGESTSGQKLSFLLDSMGVNNVLVVVSRWFGGVHLGPARFKYIANTGRELLEACGFERKERKK